MQKLKRALAIPLPASFDDLRATLASRRANSSRALLLLMLYVQEHPYRAFFSGRDERLPFNTLTVRMKRYKAGGRPAEISYAVENANLTRCPAAVYDSKRRSKKRRRRPKKEKPKKEHPKNHWGYIDERDEGIGITIWVWHF